MTDLERFDPRSFVSQLLGMGDMTGFMEQLKDAQAAAAPDGKAMTAEETRKKLLSGKFTLRDFKQQLETVNAMGPIGKLAGKMPGMGGLAAMMGGAQQDEATKAMRRIAYILDAMTPAELDSDAAKFLEPSGVKAPQGTARPPNPHILRLARGSGTSVDEVEQLFIQYRMAETMFKRAAGQKARQAIGPGGKPSAAQIQAMMANMPPQQRAQFQGSSARADQLTLQPWPLRDSCPTCARSWGGDRSALPARVCRLPHRFSRPVDHNCTVVMQLSMPRRCCGAHACSLSGPTSFDST